jgi:hypothetical protein
MDRHRPRRDQQHIEIPELLCGDADDRLRHVPGGRTRELAPDERRQELRVEPGVIATQMVVRDGRAVVAEELLRG